MRGNARLMRLHYAEADNELHHLLIMESLGGSAAFVYAARGPGPRAASPGAHGAHARACAARVLCSDRFVAQHLAFAYFWYCVAVYLVHPRAAYHLSELIEEHAYHTYDAFVTEHADVLRAQPVPEVARRYYEGGDALRDMLRDDDAGASSRRPATLRSLHDVFVRVRDDEAAHWDTLVRLVSYDSLDAPEGCEVTPTAA